MSYKYDPQNGYRNADQLNADIDEFNSAVVRAVNEAKECERKEKDPDNATRSFINKTSLSIEEEIEKEKLNKEAESIKENTGKQEKNEVPSYYIAAKIKDDMKKDEIKEEFER